MLNIRKMDLLTHFNKEKERWIDLKGAKQNMVDDIFITNVVMVLDWVLHDIENMEFVKDFANEVCESPV